MAPEYVPAGTVHWAVHGPEPDRATLVQATLMVALLSLKVTVPLDGLTPPRGAGTCAGTVIVAV